MYNAIDGKLILFPEIGGSVALRGCNFNIIRESDLNFMFTFSVAIGAGENGECKCFNSKLVIVFMKVSVLFDSLKSKSVKSTSNGVTYFTLIVS